MIYMNQKEATNYLEMSSVTFRRKRAKGLIFDPTKQIPIIRHGKPTLKKTNAWSRNALDNAKIRIAKDSDEIKKLSPTQQAVRDKQQAKDNKAKMIRLANEAFKQRVQQIFNEFMGIRIKTNQV